VQVLLRYVELRWRKIAHNRMLQEYCVSSRPGMRVDLEGMSEEEDETAL
jgi:hypothetical protein